MRYTAMILRGFRLALPEGGIERLQDLVERLVQLLQRDDPDLPDALDYQAKLRIIVGRHRTLAATNRHGGGRSG